MVLVKISKEVYLTSLKYCKNYLHGRIILSKGDKPLTRLKVCKKLDFIWKYLEF